MEVRTMQKCSTRLMSREAAASEGEGEEPAHVTSEVHVMDGAEEKPAEISARKG